MSIKAEIIADSINPKDYRLTTFILEYPRFVHAELMTHRVFSKNAASSRAIPIEKMIQQVVDNPAMPVWWGKNQGGMQAKEELDDIIKDQEVYNVRDCFGNIRHEFPYLKISKKQKAKEYWLSARDTAIRYVQELEKLGLHKQISNRILEPWFNIRIILSGTEFENFFALRYHPDAQPEIKALAELMLEEYNKSEPKSLEFGDWHIPFGDKIDEFRLWTVCGLESSDMEEAAGDLSSIVSINKILSEARRKISVARCARISYFNFEGKDDYEADIKLCDRLFGSIPRHLSPTEHVAQCLDSDERIGNFTGFKQYRYFFKGQNLGDSRVIKKYHKK
jgi:thymidylate synthase ThyX